jgi:hypothetical protein
MSEDECCGGAEHDDCLDCPQHRAAPTMSDAVPDIRPHRDWPGAWIAYYENWVVGPGGNPFIISPWEGADKMQIGHSYLQREVLESHKSADEGGNSDGRANHPRERRYRRC